MTTRVFTEGRRLVTIPECEGIPRDIDCPCCKAKGAHAVFDGPDRDTYPCATCGGDRYFEVSTDKSPAVVLHNAAIKKVSYGFPGDDEDETKAAVTLEITVASIELAEKLRSLAGTGPYGLGIWDEALPF